MYINMVFLSDRAFLPCSGLRLIDNSKVKRQVFFNPSDYFSRYCLNKTTGHLFSPVANILEVVSWGFICRPPWLVFVGPSGKLINWTPSSSFTRFSRRPRKPNALLVSTTSFFQIAMSFVALLTVVPQYFLFFLGHAFRFVWTFPHSLLPKLPRLSFFHFSWRCELRTCIPQDRRRIILLLKYRSNPVQVLCGLLYCFCSHCRFSKVQLTPRRLQRNEQPLLQQKFGSKF